MGVRPMKLLICGFGYFAITMVSILHIPEKTTATIIGKTVMTTGNSFKSCRIPTAENTIYQLMKSDREHVTLLPNSPVQGNGTVVHIECQGANRGTTSWFGQDYMVCYNGEWYPSGNVCIKFCPPLNLLNSVTECTLNDKPVSCQENVRPGTVADNRCKAGYDDTSTKRNERNICLNTGNWSYQFVECFISKGYKGVLEMLKSMSFLLLKGRVEFNSFVRAICSRKHLEGHRHEVSKSNIRYLNGTVTGWDKSGKRFSFRTTFYNNADCRELISELDEDDEEREQLESEIKKFGSYCTDRGFPESFLGTGAIYYDEDLKANRSVGVLTRLFKSFSIFVGPRSDEALDDMTRFYSDLIDKNYRGK
ncbi:uncharacterized protein LOC111061328 [Nilaparvata lugens]|uniref:uncharacterized protein LOC111061328 n=1 Tax=Nilaparvata lugens TaxID=108931 RepID=UPI00193E2A0C|nr:uncharacterized protein LOC111061328 [Nilaparvata lugens]